MAETNIGVVIRQQGWFRPLLDIDNLSQFPIEKIDLVPFQPTSAFRARVILGRGPVERDLLSDVFLWFEHGEKEYPTFECPSISPVGAGLISSNKTHRLSISAQEALGLVEVSLLQPVSKSFLEQYESSPQEMAPESPASLIQKWLADTRKSLEQVIGLYALYQFPIVWEPIGMYPFVGFVDVNTMTLKASTTYTPDNFIPFRLRVDSKLKDGHLLDDGLNDFSRLGNLEFHFPLLLLQRALWQRNIQLRFLEIFLILDHLTSKAELSDPMRQERQRFYDVIHSYISDTHPEYSERVFSLKHIILQAPLKERLTLYLKTLGIEVDTSSLRDMLKIRNDLAHGRTVDSQILAQAELELRSLTRDALRRDLAQNGFNFRDTQPSE